MSKQATCFYDFGPFRLDVAERLLLRDAEVVPLTPKVFDTLLVLVEAGGHLVEKNELMTTLWPDSYVEESSLAQNISLLRKALGEGTNGHQFIQTVPKRGYRFVADVRKMPGSGNGATEQVLHEHTHTQILIEELDDLTDEPHSATSVKPLNLPAPRVKPWPLYLLLAGVGLIITVTGVYYLHTRARTNTDVAQIKSIAVLPFKTIGAQEADERLGLGMADAIILKLETLQQPVTLPTSSVFKFTERGQDPFLIGRQLGVDAVLDGTVQRDGEWVRVTAQLIDIKDGRTLWAGKFNERYSNIFTLQDSISEQLASALIPRLTSGDRERLTKRQTQNPAAYQDYLTGIYFWNKRSKEGLTKAIEYFQQAINKDPNYALAYAALADCYCLNTNYSYNIVSSQESNKAQAAAARKAIELDDTLAESHAVMAAVLANERDRAGAYREYQRALELNPNYATAHLRYSYFLLYSHYFDEALRHMRRAQELDPVSPITNGALGYMLLLARQYDESVRYCQRALELDPNVPVVHMTLGVDYELQGKYPEAIAEYKKSDAEDHIAALQAIAHAYIMSGRRAEAEAMLPELERAPRDAFNVPYNFALIYTALGDHAKAIEWLEQTKLNAMVVAMLKYDPFLDDLRSDPLFTEFLRRHKLDGLLSERPT
jgi:DNA-binding winged helix-turn-helix (wHTH) protein/TolB-like protein/Tfp pilus assembly protein PilF